jgi:hypothetical protein
VYTSRLSAAAKLLPKGSQTLSLKGKSIPVTIRFIVQRRFVSHAASPQQRKIRPVPAGVSVGTPLGSGTAGLIVTNAKRADRLFLLSNNHVLNRNNTTAYSETIQPGGADSGKTGSDRIGRLDRFVRLKKNGVNLLDAALSVPLRNAVLKPAYFGIGTVPGHVTGYKVGDRFIKTGRTTGKTTGTVHSVHTDLKVNYGKFGRLGTVSLKNQTVITGKKPISLPGDSGSVWLTAKDRLAAAVMYAGSDNGKTSIAFPVHWFMQVFGTRVAVPGKNNTFRAGKVKRVLSSGNRTFVGPLTAKQIRSIPLARARNA